MALWAHASQLQFLEGRSVNDKLCSVSTSHVQRDTQQIVMCMQEPSSLAGFTRGFLVHALSLAGAAHLMARSCGITYKGGERKQGFVRLQTRQEWFAIQEDTRHTFSPSEQIPTSSGTWISAFLSLSLHCLRGRRLFEIRNLLYSYAQSNDYHNNRKGTSVILFVVHSLISFNSSTRDTQDCRTAPHS